ncbi:MAG TPA: exodeoxyribonuclease VII small subunit [Planctomycetota bacterium]|nr:exodeoxyribonuclease VII small subunit [Planctomycetota bacterium]
MATTPVPGDSASAGSFEAKLEELNALIGALESGDLGLEDAIRTFEKGRRLHHELLQVLAGYERRIEVLTKTATGEDLAVLSPEFEGEASGALPTPSRAPAPPPPPAPPKASGSSRKKPAFDDDVPF